MTPDPIPAEIIEAAARAWCECGHCHHAGAGVSAHCDQMMRGILAAAWPLIAAHVLNAAADALNAEQCEGRYNPNACETCRAVKSLRESATAQTDPEGDR